MTITMMNAIRGRCRDRDGARVDPVTTVVGPADCGRLRRAARIQPATALRYE